VHGAEQAGGAAAEDDGVKGARHGSLGRARDEGREADGIHARGCSITANAVGRGDDSIGMRSEEEEI
jgi:hypothetical protein